MFLLNTHLFTARIWSTLGEGTEIYGESFGVGIKGIILCKAKQGTGKLAGGAQDQNLQLEKTISAGFF